MTFAKQPQSKLMLKGPAGQLEAVTTYPETPPTGVAIICHPLPLYQGTMHNKVVTTLSKAFSDLGLATVRFNFRGIGQSEGAYDDSKGEVDDLLAIIDWVKSALPDQPIWLAGFSFGAFIAAKAANGRDDIVQLLSIAPAVHHQDYQRLSDIRCPWLVIQGESDEVVPVDEVKAFAADPPSPLALILLPEVSHFFHGHLIELRELLLKHYQ